MTTQQITEQDFQHNRTFCVVHASISRDGFHVKVANRAVRITQERGGQYHLSAYGA